MTFTEVEKVLNDFCFVNTGILSGTFHVFSNKRGEEIYVGNDQLEYTAYTKTFEYSSLTPTDLVNFLETGN
ncbi:MAG TPA: hypothetical protein VNS32_10995 [Flavisolibacter sp.]|nr:hypothetical protein [Flavisolibacter sp.]